MDPRLVRVVLAATPVLLMTIWIRPAPLVPSGPCPVDTVVSCAKRFAFARRAAAAVRSLDFRSGRP